MGPGASPQPHNLYSIWRDLPEQLLGLRSLRRLGISRPPAGLLLLPGPRMPSHVLAALAARGVDVFEPVAGGSGSGGGAGSGAAGGSGAPPPPCCDPQAQSWMVEEVCGGLEGGEFPPVLRPTLWLPAASAPIKVADAATNGGRAAPALSSAAAQWASGSATAGFGAAFGYSWDEAEQGRAAVQEATAAAAQVWGVEAAVGWSVDWGA